MESILYICDADKNTECLKTHCEFKGVVGCCCHTLDIKYAKNYTAEPSAKELRTQFEMHDGNNGHKIWIEKGGV